MTNFEPLREMSTFTEEMFNRIIEFQEKKHPAWNSNLSFDFRLKCIPLHNLIFSNPDRDPASVGSTIAPYYPLREEMQKIAHYVKQLGTSATLCDLYPGNGFIGSLIGREGIDVIGLSNDHAETKTKANQIEHFYDEQCFKYSTTTLDQIEFKAALISYPPNSRNPTTQIIERKTALIIYVYTDHMDENTKNRQTGTDDMFDALSDQYTLLDQWEVYRPKDILHDIWPDMTPSPEERRLVKIFVHNDQDKIESIQSLPPAQNYDWEKDLQMALLALQAKQEIQSRGFPTNV